MANMGEALSEDEVQVTAHPRLQIDGENNSLLFSYAGHDRGGGHGRRRQHQLRRVLCHGQQVTGVRLFTTNEEKSGHFWRIKSDLYVQKPLSALP